MTVSLSSPADAAPAPADLAPTHAASTPDLPATRNSIVRDVFQRRLVGVAEEMSAALRRSAFSSIIWDMYDYSCALFSADGRMIAQAETIAAQLGVMEIACQHIARKIPLDTWQPGDVIVCNDPYQGCTHTPDIVMFTPVFVDGVRVALTSTIAHHVDIGGKAPCTTVPDNTEVFGEGLILPPMKIIRAGIANEEVFAIFATNVRMPQAALGDLRAQIAGCRTGEKRTAELVTRYGAQRFSDLNEDILDYSESYVRAALRRLETVSASASILIEDDVASPEPIEVRCTLRIENGEVDVDFSGTSAQRAHALNCPYASTVSMVSYAVKAALAPEISQNSGCNRPIRVHALAGSVLNPKHPGAVGSRHYTQQAVAEAVLRAFEKLLPDFGFAGSQIAFPALKAGGFDLRPERMVGRNEPRYFAITDILGGGTGATSTNNGMDGVDTHGGNCEILSAEIMESACPIRVLRTELVPESGGGGEFTGGRAIRRVYEFLNDDLIVNAYVQQAQASTRPWGSAGGEPGAPGGIIAEPGTPHAHALPSKAIAVKCARGATLQLQSSGGGGYGAVQAPLRPGD